MKKYRSVVVISFILLICAALYPAPSSAGVSVGINVSLPGVVIASPPAMVVIPGTYVYYPPEVGVDIFFYQGYWYRPYRGGWYISSGYNGPWRLAPAGRTPYVLHRIPPDYRRITPSHYERIPYPTVRKNWSAWERERHWDRAGYRGPRDNRGEHRGYGHERNDDRWRGRRDN